MSSASSISFKPSLLLEGINLARRAITKFTSSLDTLATQVTGFVKETGDQEKTLDNLSSSNRALATSMLARNLDPAKKFITKPSSSKVSGGDLTDNQKTIAEYLHGFYSTKERKGTKRPTQFSDLFHRLNLGSFDREELEKQVTDFKELISQQQTYFESQTGQNPLPGIDLGGFKIEAPKDSGDRKTILFTDNLFQRLKNKFKDGSEDIDLSKLKDYKLAVVDFLLGTVSRYYESGNRRKESVTTNLNAQNGYLITLVKAIDYFLKLK